VATDARSVGIRQAVVAVHVALCTLHGGMRSGQRKAGSRVIKIRTRPGRSVVTLGAGLREV